MLLASTETGEDEDDEDEDDEDDERAANANKGDASVHRCLAVASANHRSPSRNTSLTEDDADAAMAASDADETDHAAE